jgi:hypothetical protein
LFVGEVQLTVCSDEAYSLRYPTEQAQTPLDLLICRLWVASGPSPSYQPNGRFRGQSGRFASILVVVLRATSRVLLCPFLSYDPAASIGLLTLFQQLPALSLGPDADFSSATFA